MRNNQHKVLVFGEVLFDYFEDQSSVLGGAPFNIAWHLQQFGLHPVMVSKIGNDSLGNLVLAAMDELAMDKSGLQVDASYPTGRVQVTVNQGEPSYEILANQAYDFIDPPELSFEPPFKLLYHGSLALRNQYSRDTLNKLVEQSQLPVFVDINLRAPWWQASLVTNILKRATWVKLNREELFLIAAENDHNNKGNDPNLEKIRHHEKHFDLDECIELFLKSYPCKVLIVTLGEEGALAVDAEGRRYQVAPQGKPALVDAVGAGDAFASVSILGQLLNWPIKITLERAQAFASATLNIKGALSKEKSFYQPFLDQWEFQ